MNGQRLLGEVRRRITVVAAGDRHLDELLERCHDHRAGKTGEDATPHHLRRGRLVAGLLLIAGRSLRHSNLIS